MYFDAFFLQFLYIHDWEKSLFLYFKCQKRNLCRSLRPCWLHFKRFRQWWTTREWTLKSQWRFNLSLLRETCEAWVVDFLWPEVERLLVIKRFELNFTPSLNSKLLPLSYSVDSSILICWLEVLTEFYFFVDLCLPTFLQSKIYQIWSNVSSINSFILQLICPTKVALVQLLQGSPCTTSSAKECPPHCVFAYSIISSIDAPNKFVIK